MKWVAADAQGGGGGTLDQWARHRANAAFNTANGAFITANGSFDTVNIVSIYANTPSYVANSAAIYANGAFIKANSAYDSVTWTNASPAPGTPFRSQIRADSGNVNITLFSGIPNFLSSVGWIFDTTKITFPDTTTQATAFTGYAVDNVARDTANSASVYANAAFLQANTPDHVGNSASSYAN
jgi:hypothetical protein